ncbi:hypothetical protein AYO21_08691 [Fonsecaea monophora]|uniref:Uncharacterized protein n=1 Tax=Fonsecaea monophora TaxID=254056 RepID=A0A177EZZ1_9EURO|nr:hypothetical protein AYO21_08691 [Fonsecaea monophora]OAG37156.1 hypothetical protein AYO21_08691 [Fonsecaea monophora]
MEPLFDFLREDYRGPLTNAVEAQDCDQVELLLRTNNGNDEQSVDDRTLAMRTAVENDHLKMVDVLMGHGIKAKLDDFITDVHQNNTSIRRVDEFHLLYITDIESNQYPSPLSCPWPPLGMTDI